MTRRDLVSLAALVWLGCGGGDGSSTTAPSQPSSVVASPVAPSPVASGAPPASPPPTSAPPTSATTEPTLTHEQLHHVAELLRTGRTAEQRGDHAAARAALDEAVALVPSDARLLCEAGYVTYRAGHVALAAQRLDAAIAAFGPPSALSPTRRAHLGMCLYNRGLVDEAQGDLARAVMHYDESLALRPNDVVRRHRDAAAASPAAAHVPDTLDGLAAELRDGGLFVATTDRARLELALHAAVSGSDGWGDPVAPADTEVRVLAETTARSDDARPTIVALAHGVDTRVLLAVPAEGGWLITSVVDGGGEGYGADRQSFEIASASIGTLGEDLRIDVRGTRGSTMSGMHDPPAGFAADYCYVDIDESYAFVASAVCHSGARPVCFVVDEAEIAAHDDDVLYQCADANGTAMEFPGGNEQTEHHDAIVRTIVAAPDGRFTIGDAAPVERALLAARSAPSGLTDRERALASEDEEEDEELPE